MNNQIDVKTNLTLMTRLLTIEELRFLKKEITKELSRRHKLKQKEKRNCQSCDHCFYDENAHKTWPDWSNRGGYKCMAWSKNGRIIPTKHKAPSWCPMKKDDEMEETNENRTS